MLFCSAPKAPCLPPSDALVSIQDYLLIAPLEVWLDVTRRANCDDHLALLTWISEQAECDTTLAQLIFYRCQPRHVIRRVDGASAHMTKLADVCRSIVTKLADGFYPDGHLGLQPDELTKPMIALRNHCRDLPAIDQLFAVPDAFLSAPDIPPSTLATNWSAQDDPEIKALYLDAGLALEAADTAPPVVRSHLNTSVLASFTEILKRTDLSAT